jgi:site-specific recombinase XerC
MLDNYSSQAPETLTPPEVSRLIETLLTFGNSPAEKFRAHRDYTIVMLGLTVGLREHEIVALTIGDAFDSEQRAREYVSLRIYKGHTGENRTQLVFIPSETREALDQWLRLKHAAREPLSPDAPVFLGRAGKALSTRLLRHAFKVWQSRARLSRAANFHMLRHTGCTAVQEQTGDIRATQEFARHKSVRTTMVYTHPSREHVSRAVAAAAASWRAPLGRRWQVRR